MILIEKSKATHASTTPSSRDTLQPLFKREKCMLCIRFYKKYTKTKYDEMLSLYNVVTFSYQFSSCPPKDVRIPPQEPQSLERQGSIEIEIVVIEETWVLLGRVVQD